MSYLNQLIDTENSKTQFQSSLSLTMPKLQYKDKTRKQLPPHIKVTQRNRPGPQSAYFTYKVDGRTFRSLVNLNNYLRDLHNKKKKKKKTNIKKSTKKKKAKKKAKVGQLPTIQEVQEVQEESIAADVKEGWPLELYLTFVNDHGIQYFLNDSNACLTFKSHTKFTGYDILNAIREKYQTASIFEEEEGYYENVGNKKYYENVSIFYKTAANHLHGRTQLDLGVPMYKQFNYVTSMFFEVHGSLQI